METELNVLLNLTVNLFLNLNYNILIDNTYPLILSKPLETLRRSLII